ncbi:hypothetical protein EI94DRAFT_560347 [Lactarius quietus]|nr:hypothetical protein EI94DRAFT_560347 [Lactarius quietus]
MCLRAGRGVEGCFYVQAFFEPQCCTVTNSDILEVLSVLQRPQMAFSMSQRLNPWSCPYCNTPSLLLLAGCADDALEVYGCIRTYPRMQFYWLLLFEFLRCHAQYRYFARSPAILLYPRRVARVGTDISGASHAGQLGLDLDHIPFPHTSSRQTLIRFRSRELARPGLSSPT